MQLAIHLKEQQEMNGQRISEDGGLIRQLSVIDLPGALNSASGTPLLATHVKALLTERIDRLRPSQQLTLKVSMLKSLAACGLCCSRASLPSCNDRCGPPTPLV